MNTTERESVDFETKTVLKWVVLSYAWRMAAYILVLGGADLILLLPKISWLAWVLLAAIILITLSDGIRRILRSRAGLRFAGNSLTILGYCGSSFRLDDLCAKDFLLVQNSAERHVDTGRVLIKKKGIYLRGVGDFKALCTYVQTL